MTTPSTSHQSLGHPANEAPYRLFRGVSFGEDVIVHAFSNLYGCTIGTGTRIGTFVEIQKGASIGSKCKIESHAFICEGVRIEDEAFVGHGVVFVNDKYPRATRSDGHLQGDSDWDLRPILIQTGASIGSGAVILSGVQVGAGAMIGAGAVVARDVAPGATVAGTPARPLGA